jgi:hypothetical protein
MANKNELADIESIRASEDTAKQVCGVIMPISDTDGYRPKHWLDIAEIIYSVIDEAGFRGKIVSDSKVSNIIHNEIVQNIAENPIIICDVSSKNPNVMFELGLRLAFDKPTIVIKDNETNYNFDTSPIRHLEYPKDLRHSEIIKFKIELKNMLIATYEAFNEGSYVTFLQSFTKYKPKLQEKEVGLEELMNKQFENLYSLLQKRVETISPNVKQIDEKKQVVYNNGDNYVKKYFDLKKTDKDRFNKLPLDDRINILKDQPDFETYFKDFTELETRSALVYGLTYAELTRKKS